MSNQNPISVDDQEWKNLIQNHLDFLIADYGFSIIENTYYPELFGYRLTVLEADKFIIRVEIDKRILVMYIKSKDHPTFKSILEILVGYINQRPTSDFVDRTGSNEEQLRKQSKLFNQYASNIFALGESDNIQDHVTSIEQYVEKQIENRKRE